MMMDELQFVNVAGFFYSGSSAIVDLLKEVKGGYESNAEIRFIKDPYGIADMEDKLINHWDLINSSAAISDFRAMCQRGSRYGKGLFSPMGHGYKQFISPDFMAITDEYIKNLVNFTYHADYYHYKFKKSYFRYVIDRYRWAIEYLTKGKLKTANRNTEICYFSHPSQEEFNKATQNYFNNLFANYVKNDDVNFIILDQAVSPNNTQVIHRYFKKSKMIIVDRDPRDIFVDEIQWGVNLDQYETKEAAERFVNKTKKLRSNIIYDEDIFRIQFEDLVINYDETVRRVFAFLDIKEEDHIEKMKYLNPSKSIKNVGIWRKFYSSCKSSIDTITESLPDMLYDSSALFNK